VTTDQQQETGPWDAALDQLKNPEKHTYKSCLDYPSFALFCGDFTDLCAFQRIRRRIGQR
jgi:hypothetical protein